MKLGAHGPNRRNSGPRAQIMRKSIFTAESQFSWNWCSPPKRLTSGPPAQVMRKSIFTAESQFSWNWVLTAEIGGQAVPEQRSWENQSLRPNRNFHEIRCSRPKSAHKRSPSSDLEKINFYGRIAIFMKLGAHGPNRRTSGPRAQIMRKSIFTAESQFSWNWVLKAQMCAQAIPELVHEKINYYRRIAIFMKLVAHGPNRRKSRPRPQMMRKSIFSAESQFSCDWVLKGKIDGEAVLELRSWENQFLRPNRNFHEL